MQDINAISVALKGVLMNKDNNIRGIAQQKNIKTAFLQLLDKKKPNEISVQEICSLAEINRTTFYLHFSNISELLEDIENDIYNEAKDRILPKQLSAAELISSETMLRVLSYMRKNKSIYVLMMSGSGIISTKSKMINNSYKSQIVEELINVIYETYISPALKQSNNYNANEYGYYFEFCKNGTLSVIMKWLISGCNESELFIASLIEKILKRCLP
jgi:AcrR family transcriptional regulator